MKTIPKVTAPMSSTPIKTQQKQQPKPPTAGELAAKAALAYSVRGHAGTVGHAIGVYGC
jgi:hypothetical protein